MTEDEYRSELKALHEQIRQRMEVLVDVLVMQPPIRLARQSATEFAWWCVAQGALHADAVLIAQRARQRDAAATKGQ